MPDRTDDARPDRDDTAAIARQTHLVEAAAELLTTAPPVIPPCPSWCVSTAPLHRLDFDLRDGVYVRTHEAYSGQIVSVEAAECSNGLGGPVTLDPLAVLLYGADFDGRAVTPAEVQTLAAELVAAVAVRDRITAGCPAWCNGKCDRDVVGDSITHWSDVRPLPASDGFVPDDLPQPTISAVAHQAATDQPLGDVSFMISSEDEQYRGAGRAREFAHAILAFVDEVAPSGQ